MKTIFKKLLVLLLLMIHQYGVIAQNKDSKDSVLNSIQIKTVKYFTQSQFENADSVGLYDFSLTNFQNYIPRNNLGNNGLAFTNWGLYSGINSSELGFRYAKNNYQPYFFSPQNLRFYNTRTPFTDLFYVIGSKREQQFRLAFSYNVKKNWNFTAYFNRARSEGFYTRQNTNDNHLAISTNYKSLNNRYYFLGSVIYNSAKNAENGGLSEDSVFFNDKTNADKKLFAINLSGAKRETKNRSIYLKHYLNLGHTSDDSLNYYAVLPTSRLMFTTLIEDNSLKYEDDGITGTYYSNTYYDTVKTLDTAHNYKIENELAWKRLDNGLHRGVRDMIGVGFNIKHQFVKINQQELVDISPQAGLHGVMNASYNNVFAGAEFFNTYSNNRLWWTLAGNYGLSGYNKNNYLGSATLKKQLADSASCVYLLAETKSQSPDFIYNKYISNHLRWSNNFNNSIESRLMLSYYGAKYKWAITAGYNMYSNVLYFNDSAKAAQYKGTVGVLMASVKKDFTFRNLHLNNKITYQHVPDSSVIRLPELLLEHSLYFESIVFKGAMRLEIGVAAFYSSAYYANAYMPVSAQFYLQNNKKYGDYVALDFFINARIKSARIFFKIDHINNGLMSNNYMFIPGYPINGRAFKLGVSWRFFD